MINASLRLFLWLAVLAEQPVKKKEQFVVNIWENTENSEGTVQYFIPNFMTGIEGFFAHPADTPRKDSNAVTVIQENA